MTVMKRTALALLLCLLAFAATAQNVTVIGPITPGHCAAFSSTTVIKDCGGVPPVGPGTSVVNDIAIFNNTTGSLLADATGFSITPGGPLNINPTTSTYNQGAVITQSGPTTTVGGPLSYNLINVTHQSAVTGAGVDATGNLKTVSAAFRVNLTTGGANLAGQANDAILGTVSKTIAGVGAEADQSGVTGTAYSNVAGNTSAGLYGMVNYAFLDVGGTTGHLVGIESDLNIAATVGGAATYRAGFRAMNAGSHQAGTLDSAFVVGSVASGGNWQKMMSLSGLFGSANPIATTGDLFFNDQAMTVANVFNMSNLTVTANIMNFPNVVVTGAGVGTFRGGQVVVNLTSGGTAALTTTTNSTSGSSSLDLFTSLGTNEIFIGAFEAANTQTAVGVTRGNYVQIVTAGAANNGLLFGTSTNKPIIIGVNNAQVATFPTTGGFQVALIAGGGTASSSLTLESTSGAGTTDKIVFQTGNQVYAGSITTGQLWNIGSNTAPNSNVLLTLNANAAALPAGEFTGALLQVGQVDGTAARVLVDSFKNGTATIASWIELRTAAGTNASKTAVQSGQTIGGFFFQGHDGTSFDASDAPTVQGFAGENFNTTSHGTGFDIRPVPNTTLFSILGMRINPSGGVYIGTTAADPGAQSLRVDGQIFEPNVTQSSAAQTGTVCWTTGTGKFTVDTTVGCLTSLEEAKDITGPLAPATALDLVLRINPFSFRYRPGWGDGGHYEQFGLGAHQVASVDERMAGRDPEGALQGVRYQELTAVLVGAIQQLKADNDDLRNEIRRAR